MLNNPFFSSLQNSANHQGFSSIREKAQVALKNLELPSTREERWKYTNVSKLSNESFSFQSESQPVDVSPYTLNGLEVSTFVFVDGVFQKEQSDNVEGDIVIQSLRDAETSHSEIINKHMAQYAESDENAFAAINSSYFQDGVFIHVPEAKVLSKPVHIISLTSGSSASVLRNLVIIEADAQADIIETVASLDDGAAFSSIVTEIVVAKHGQGSYVKIQNENDQSYQVTNTVLHQSEQSNFHCHAFTFGGAVVRNNLRIILDGEHIESYLHGLYLTSGNQHVDNQSYVDHAKPNCMSDELYKGIMADQSTGVFNGKIMVRQDAQKTNAYQTNRNLLLSNDAQINSKPELEIYADDVKCSHGSTTGQLDQEAIFYMRARGISEQNAQKIMMNAFAKEVINSVKSDELKDYIGGLVDDKLKGMGDEV